MTVVASAEEVIEVLGAESKVIAHRERKTAQRREQLEAALADMRDVVEMLEAVKDAADKEEARHEADRAKWEEKAKVARKQAGIAAGKARIASRNIEKVGVFMGNVRFAMKDLESAPTDLDTDQFNKLIVEIDMGLPELVEKIDRLRPKEVTE